jgi:hypothetical protein
MDRPPPSHGNHRRLNSIENDDWSEKDDDENDDNGVPPRALSTDFQRTNIVNVESQSDPNTFMYVKSQHFVASSASVQFQLISNMYLFSYSLSALQERRTTSTKTTWLSMNKHVFCHLQGSARMNRPIDFLSISNRVKGQLDSVPTMIRDSQKPVPHPRDVKSRYGYTSRCYASLFSYSNLFLFPVVAG